MQDVTNFADLVRRAAASHGARPALRSHATLITWSELDQQVDAVAANLAALHLPGDEHGPARVAVALPNVPEFAAVFFGVLRAGLVAVPVNPAYTGRELTHIVTDSGAAVVVGTRTVTDAVEAAHRYTLGGNLRELFTAGSTPPGHSDLAILLYTSGTAGAPKGAMLSHRALLANHEQLAAIDPPPVRPDDVLLLAVPLFHAYGLNSGLGAVAYHGACGVLVERFDPADSLEVIERHGVTGVVGVPPMFIAWSLMGERLTRAWAGVRLAVCGASPLDAAAERRFVEATGQPVHQGYGLTEAAPVVTSTLTGATVKPGSIGRAIPGVELKLVDAAGEEVLLDEDDEVRTDPGEIVVRGRNLFDGYWPGGEGAPDADGWWATGDVAYADEDGDLFIVDRLGELILVSGFNVYPHEVELVLAAHPAVVEAAALGVPHPYTGQTVKVVVVRRPGSQVTAEELIAHCERNLARFKCPTAVEFVDELPHSATGKIRKAALR
ncbi:AMP-binding protein [Dactylosporangium siamense]|uniref:Long-chain acyl-CoA synthetase n=1 Tax=Dactylosporangium siamense TaxID=685454 RepID=A0A919UFQ1_9ACTN|nr:AMP-binding protein [Dactylosporangium siamense]GIG50426.1 long-chain acyl-CoA synthetase [Dactylosporangium siamense]